MSPDRPLNIWSRSEEEIGRLMSHFARTPFTLDGVRFGSVEAFYTWLLAGFEARRVKVAPLWGPRAKDLCPNTVPEFFDYHGRSIGFESREHHELILRANRAKLGEHPEIARAFAATAPRPIVHRLPEKEDPHDVFCWIMRTLRDELTRNVVAGKDRESTPANIGDDSRCLALVDHPHTWA